MCTHAQAVMPDKRPPKLRQRSNGSLFAYFYDPSRSPNRKRVYLGVVIEDDLDDPLEDAPASVVGTFYQEYHDPYMRGAYDPWEPKEEKERLRLSEAFGRYIQRDGITDNTRRTVRVSLREFESEYVEGDPMASDVTEEAVKSYVRRDSISDSYSKSLYSRLHAAFQWMEAEDLINHPDNPMNSLSKPRVRDKTKSFLEPSSWTSLVDKIREDYERRVERDDRKGIKKNEVIWILPILKFATATGMRPTEIKNLQVEDINFEMGRVEVPVLEGNKGRGRVVPMCPMAEDVALEESEGHEGTDYLFGGSRSAQFCTRQLSRNVKGYIKDTDGVPNSTDLYTATRHTFASWLAMLGYDAMTLKKVMGHSSISVTEQYMHVAPGALDRNMASRYESFAKKMDGIGFFESRLQRIS